MGLGLCGLLAAGCSNDEPPNWLSELATAAGETTTTTTSPAETSPTTTTTTIDPDRVEVVDLEVGQCLDDPSLVSGEPAVLTTSATADCADAHDAEVYAVLGLSIGPQAPYPGNQNLRDRATEQCREPFEEFVGIAWEQSVLEISVLWPTRRSWRAGDRGIVCSVFHVDGDQLEGSMRASAA